VRGSGDGIGRFSPRFFLKIFSGFLKELATETKGKFSSKYFRVDFHQDYCRDFKIKAENPDKILAENSGRKIFLCFARSSLRNPEKILGKNLDENL
jgi:hypothetical protein